MEAGETVCQHYGKGRDPAFDSEARLYTLVKCQQGFWTFRDHLCMRLTYRKCRISQTGWKFSRVVSFGGAGDSEVLKSGEAGQAPVAKRFPYLELLKAFRTAHDGTKGNRITCSCCTVFRIWTAKIT